MTFEVCVVFHTDWVCSLDELCAAGWLTDSGSILSSDPELVLHVLLQACYHVGETRYEAWGDFLIVVAVLLDLLHNVALDGTAAIVVGSLPCDRDGLGCWILSLHLDGWVWFLCGVNSNN